MVSRDSLDGPSVQTIFVRQWYTRYRLATSSRPSALVFFSNPAMRVSNASRRSGASGSPRRSTASTISTARHRLDGTIRPDVIVTMNPAPYPGQHGHHQAAGVLATEAFTAAADPRRFPEQLTKEGLSIWQVRKLYYGGGRTGPRLVPMR